MQHSPQSEKSGGIATFAIENPHFIIVVWLIASILGVLSLVLLPKDLLPSANLPAVQILSFYSGMPVEHVEQDLTYLFERYTGQAVGIESQESRSLEGVSIVKNYFNSSIDLSNAIAQTGSLVMSVLRKLPPGAQPPLILPFDPMASVPLAMCAIGGDDDKTQAELQDLGRYWVSNTIQSVPGAMAPTVMGGQLRQVVVYLDPKKLEGFNFSPVQVMNKLNGMNTFIPAGDIKIGKYDYQIVSNGLVEKIADINNFYLRSQNGVGVQLKEVGHAEDSHAIQTNVVRIDGKNQVYVPIYRQPGANSLAVVDQVRVAVKKLESTLKGFKLNIVSDQSIFIRKAIEAITHEALIGGGFAAIMVLLFLGSYRATFAVMLSLPLSLIGAFACLKALGQTLNVMTLGGLALSVGVLVDNAIVVIEVIMQKRAAGMSARDASAQGASEVAMPVLASTLSTLIVFLPVLFLKGVVQILFSALSIAVISAMVASYFAAMTVIPLFTTHFLTTAELSTTGLMGWFQRKVEAATQGYGKSLAWVIHHRKIILPGSILVLVATAALFVGHIGAELFPKADSGGFRLDMRGPTGYRIEETTALAAKVESKIREYIPADDLAMVIMNAGVYYGYSAAFTPNSGTQDFFFNVELKEDRKETSQYYAKILREKIPKDFPEIEFGVELGGLLSSALNGGLLSPIDIQIGGPSVQISHQYALDILEDLKKVRGATDVRIQQRFDSPEIKLNIDREKASELGLNPDQVIKNVVSSVSNSATYDPAIWIDPKTGIDYFFGVQFPQTDISSFQDFMQIPITSAEQNRSIPLSRVATTEQIKGPIELNHKNLQPVIDIYLDAQGRDIAGVAGDAEKVLNHHALKTGYWADIRGEISAMKEAVGSLGGGFLLAAVLVYLILVVQFRSFLLPGIIMTTVPMGMVGVIVVLALTHTYFSIQAAIGCIFVIGVAVSHGVLLVEYILERTKIDPTIDQAILSGAMARLRPITMTSLASILGLVPMALGIGQGSEANIPLGRAVIGGQILSTLLNFYLVPALFRMFYAKKKN
jgi:multidrug efflux pump subunit AcrB